MTAVRRPTDVAELLTRAAAHRPDRAAVVESAGGRSRTWAALDAEVDRFASGLTALGLVAGYRVVIAMGNRVEFVVAYLAVVRAGLVAVPVNPRSVTGELARVLADCGARVVVADSAAIGSVRAAVAGLVDARAGADDDQLRRLVVPRVVVVGASRLPGEKDYDDLCAAGPTRAVGARDEESLAVLLYTSGTSGRPRAAMLSHRALLSNIEQVAAVEPTMIVGNDVVLAVLPLFHVYGLNAVLGQALRQGATLVLVDGFEAEGSLRVVEDHGVSVLPVAPPVFAAWVAIDDLERRLAGVRLVLSGSAPLPLEAVERFSARTGVAVHQGYGLTEAAPVVTSTLCSASLKVGSVGRALPGVTLRLVDGAGRAAEGEDVGEVELRGDNLFSGYWPDGVDGPAADGWWRTGDVGYLDADGDLFLVDRLRELVIVSGFNVYPREVEEVVSEVAGVAESGVIGVDDPVTGEAVVAYVRPRAESTLSAEQLAAAVHDHCRRRLAPFKRPSAVHVVAELPHTVTGKVAKGELRGTERRRTLGLLA